jgi:hypothetical protein
MLNDDLTHVVLAQSYWHKKSWGFPKGKVNEEEAAHRCAGSFFFCTFFLHFFFALFFCTFFLHSFLPTLGNFNY